MPMSDDQLHDIYRAAFGLADSRLVGDQIKFARAIEAQARKEAAQRCAEICKLWEERYVEKQFMDNAAAAEQCAGSISEEFGL